MIRKPELNVNISVLFVQRHRHFFTLFSTGQKEFIGIKFYKVKNMKKTPIYQLHINHLVKNRNNLSRILSSVFSKVRWLMGKQRKNWKKIHKILEFKNTISWIYKKCRKIFTSLWYWQGPNLSFVVSKVDKILFQLKTWDYIGWNYTGNMYF